MSKLEFKEGQTYVCTKSTEEYWTEGKEYEVTLTTYGIPVLTDNSGNNWSATALNLDKHQFKLKEKVPSSELDLNKLTLEELKEYVTIMENYNIAEIKLYNFIRRNK